MKEDALGIEWNLERQSFSDWVNTFTFVDWYRGLQKGQSLENPIDSLLYVHIQAMC